MYTKCVYIFPVSGVSADLPLKQKRVNGVVRRTVYTKCVCIVPVSGVSADVPLRQKKRLLVL